MTWLLAAAGLALVLKVSHDTRAYNRAWRAERVSFERQLERYEAGHQA